jgi:hypothetical protein
MRAPKLLGLVLFTVATALAAAPARAQVVITMHDNRVSLVAKDATLEQILAEWTKVAQTKIVSSKRIPGGPITVQLTDVPEAEALDILLRDLSGYIAFLRTPPVAGLSRFDRIIVMPTGGALVAGALSTTPTSQADLVNWNHDAETVQPPAAPLVRENYPADDEVNWTRGPELVSKPLRVPLRREDYPADDEVHWIRGPEPVAQPPALPLIREDFAADDEVNWNPLLRSEGVPARATSPKTTPGMPPAPVGVAVPGMPTPAAVPRRPAQQPVPSDEVVR